MPNMPAKRPELRTERLLLRPFALSDAEKVAELANAKEIAQYTQNIPYPYGVEDAREFISQHPDAFREGKFVVLAITRRDDGILMGTIGLTLDWEHDKAEMGYWIGLPYWNRGYCSEAARAMLDYGFESLHLHRIQATHFQENPASGRVMQKIGMKREGCLRGVVRKWGEYVDLVYYGMLHQEWDDLRQDQEE